MLSSDVPVMLAVTGNTVQEFGRIPIYFKTLGNSYGNTVQEFDRIPINLKTLGDS